MAFLDQNAVTSQASISAMVFDGMTEPCRVVRLSPPVDGLLKTVAVEKGDSVHKGQIVATLESAVEEATLKLNHAQTQLVGELKKQEVYLQYLEKKLAYEERLFSQGILSEDEIEQRRTDWLLAQAGYTQAKENLHLAELEKARSEAALDLRRVRSPIDGMVTQRFLSAGELVTRQYESKILEIAQLDPMIVEVLVPAAFFDQIQEGRRAAVKPDIRPEEVFEAQVKLVDAIVDPGSGTFRVRLEILNPKTRLPAGLKCGVVFTD
jgi:RND family efflux transporter MFP subunit